MEMMDMFQVAIGVYLLYCVITGKGKLYENEYLKDDVPREKYVKTIRLLSLITSVLVIASAVLSMTNVMASGTTGGWILWGVSFALIVVLCVYTVKCTDRKKANAAQKAPPTIKKENIKAAFEFDDEESDADKQKKE